MRGYIYLLTTDTHGYIGSHQCNHTDMAKALFDGYMGSGKAQRMIKGWKKTVLGFAEDCMLVEELLLSTLNCQNSDYFLNEVNHTSHTDTQPITDYELEQVESFIMEIENVINN